MQDDSIILNADFPNKDVDYPLPWETDTLGNLIKVGSDPASWLVDELLALDGLSMLLGPPKAGKSSLSRCLVAAVVGMRNNWLGKKVTEHGTVLYISLEERRRTIMDHFAKFSVTDPDDGKIWPMSDVMGHKLIIVKNPTERPDDVYKWLEFQIQEAWCRLVVIDPIIRFLHLNDINDYGSTMQAFDPLIALSRKYSTHICCLHHRRKATALQFRDDALGSQALNASVDTVLSLAVDKDECRQISAYGRDDAYLSKTELYYHEESGWIDTSPTPPPP